MKSLCVIPARSGSKGLKNKNILELKGKPIISYSIEACLNTGIFDDVFVATDSEKYREIAIKYGAKAPYPEPEFMADDNSSSTEPVLYFYEMLREEYDLLWCMQPTSPLRTSEDIWEAYKIIQADASIDFVISTNIIDPHYFHWALKDFENGMSGLFFGNEFLVDRSELPFWTYRPNGAIKVGRTASVLKYRNFMGGSIKRFDMPEERSIHIRSQFDLDICETILSRSKNNAAK